MSNDPLKVGIQQLCKPTEVAVATSVAGVNDGGYLSRPYRCNKSGFSGLFLFFHSLNKCLLVLRLEEGGAGDQDLGTVAFARLGGD